jgi:tol-pal system protein YbgF
VKGEAIAGWFVSRRVALRLGCGAVLLLGAIGFAHAGLFDDDEARKQIATEKQRVDELKNELKKQQDAVDARIVKLEEALKNQALLDLFTQLEALKLEMSKLRGQLEVLNNNVENTAKRQRDMYVDLDTRVRRFEQQGGTVPVPAPAAPAAAAPVPATAATAAVAAQAKVPPVTAASAPAAIPAPAATAAAAQAKAPPVAAASVPAAIPAPAAASAPTAAVATAAAASAAVATTADPGVETHAYELAQGQRRSGNYQGAIVAFQNFIKQYPKSSLAPRAQYWIGDSYFNLHDFKLAIANQQTLIKTYPDSPSVPDGMLNIASSQIDMGESNAGRKTLEDLMAKYPVSEATEKARRRLATLSAPASTPAGTPPAVTPAAPKR